MNQGPANTPTINIARAGDLVELVIGRDRFTFGAANGLEAERATKALHFALEAGRAQGRAEAANARAKPNIVTMGQRVHIENVGTFFCTSQDEAQHAARLIDNIFRDASEPKPAGASKRRVLAPLLPPGVEITGAKVEIEGFGAFYAHSEDDARRAAEIMRGAFDRTAVAECGERSNRDKILVRAGGNSTIVSVTIPGRPNRVIETVSAEAAERAEDTINEAINFVAEEPVRAPVSPLSVSVLGFAVNIDGIGTISARSDVEAKHAAELITEVARRAAAGSYSEQKVKHIELRASGFADVTPKPDVAERVFRAGDLPEKVEVTTGPVSAAEIVANFEALAAAQDTIAALRADVKTDEIKVAALEAEIRRMQDEHSRLFFQKREVETSLVAARDAREEWKIRAEHAEAAVDAIRGKLDAPTAWTNDDVIAEIVSMKSIRDDDVLRRGDAEDEDEAHAEARHNAELALLEALRDCAAKDFNPAAAHQLAQAFAALRGAE